MGSDKAEGRNTAWTWVSFDGQVYCLLQSLYRLVSPSPQEPLIIKFQFDVRNLLCAPKGDVLSG